MTELPDECLGKLARVKDSAMRQDLTELWFALEPDDATRSREGHEARERDQKTHELDTRMYAKAQQGDYGGTVRALFDGKRPPGPGAEVEWNRVRKEISENRTDQL